jgi:hypothetical protein
MPTTLNINTVQDVVERGLSYLRRFSYKGPIARDVMYHHAGVQQQRMFAQANAVNPEFFGAQAVGILSNGAVDLKLLAPPLAMCERVLRVTIEDPGTSGYVPGQRVRIITTQEMDVLTLPPRAFIHDRVIQQVGSDLVGVVSIRAYYSELPPHYDGLTPEDTLVRLESPFDHALSVAVALELLHQTMDMPDEGRQAAIAIVEKEFQQEMATFMAHVAGSAPATTYRSRTQPPRP